MDYRIRGFQAGDESAHLAFEKVVVQDWVWPFAHDADGLKRVVEDPSFDPDLHLYAVADGDLVGFTTVWQIAGDVDGAQTAFILFPKTLPGHEAAREPLVEQLISNLKARGFAKVEMWGCTMWPDSFAWCEAHGFRESPDRPRGYKVYYTYDLLKGGLSSQAEGVRTVRTEDDHREAAGLARIWYKRPASECLEFIRRMEPHALSHLIVEQHERVIGACLAAASDQRPTLAAIFYIYVENPVALRKLLSRVAAECRARGMEKLLVDLIYEHRHFEPTYQDLGFVKEVEYAMYEKRLD